jgi:hypothetical protein
MTGLPGWAIPSSSSEFAHQIGVTNHQLIAQAERQAPTTAPHHYRVSGLVPETLCAVNQGWSLAHEAFALDTLHNVLLGVIPSRGRKAAMTHQQLDPAYIGAGLQQVGGEGVAANAA